MEGGVALRLELQTVDQEDWGLCPKNLDKAISFTPHCLCLSDEALCLL